MFSNLKKSTFCADKLVFLNFFVSAKGIDIDEENIKRIQDWPKLTSVGNVRNLHGLASIYRRYVKDFSSLIAPLIEVIKKNVGFKWGGRIRKGT